MQNHNFYLPHLMVRGSLPRVIENYAPPSLPSAGSLTKSSSTKSSSTACPSITNPHVLVTNQN